MDERARPFAVNRQRARDFRTECFSFISLGPFEFWFVKTEVKAILTY